MCISNRKFQSFCDTVKEKVGFSLMFMQYFQIVERFLVILTDIKNQSNVFT